MCVDGVAADRLLPEVRRTGILFEDNMLFPHLLVGDNLAWSNRHSHAVGTIQSLVNRAVLLGYKPYFPIRRPVLTLQSSASCPSISFPPPI
jgi:ABC-type Fe3+/spermidine/putrescine transport system ATPase subunit